MWNIWIISSYDFPRWVSKLETQESQWFSYSSNSKAWDPGEVRCTSSLEPRETSVPVWGQLGKRNSLLLKILFALFRPLTDGMRPTHLLTYPTKSPENTDTPRMIFDQMCGHPVVQPTSHIKLTITISHSITTVFPLHVVDLQAIQWSSRIHPVWFQGGGPHHSYLLLH